MSKMKPMQTRTLFAVLLCGVSLHAAAELPANDGYKHMGVATCAASQCHGSAIPRDGSNVMQNEYVTWTQSDPHSKAFELLNNELSRAMARRLGLNSASSAAICLDCHADNIPSAQRGEKFQLSDGVGCESCHGGAENWLATHYDTPAVSHSDNINAGLYPTEDTAARAELCLSCHLGNENKFATHRIMAAGHPRLAFELDTFSELWRMAGRQPHYRGDADYAERKGLYRHSVVWASGLLAEARQRLRLVQGDTFSSDGLFPELGLYDCHACHRSMQGVQWRALPRHGGSGPGMPFLNDGSLVLSLALSRVLAPEAATQLEAQLPALHRASSSDLDAVRSTANALDSTLRSIQTRVTPKNLENRERALLREILAMGAAGEFLDYASAEQAFMAVQMLVFEIGDSRWEERLTGLGDALQDDERYRPAQFVQLLQAFDGDASN